MSRLMVHTSCPEWSHKWIDYCWSHFIPTWDMTVEMKKMDESEVHGQIFFNSEYESGKIELSDVLTDDEEGHIAIIHEFIHPIIGRYDTAAHNIAIMLIKDNRHIEREETMNVVEEMKRQAKEYVTTRMARIMYPLIKEKLNANQQRVNARNGECSVISI